MKISLVHNIVPFGYANMFGISLSVLNFETFKLKKGAYTNMIVGNLSSQDDDCYRVAQQIIELCHIRDKYDLEKHILDKNDIKIILNCLCTN